MSGDLAETERLAAKLELLEAPAGQLQLIRGLSCFYSGDMAKARRLFGEAYADDSNDLAALSMLSILEVYFEDRVASDELLFEVVKRKPRRGREEMDLFFQAYALMWSDPDRSVEIMRQLSLRRPSALVRTMLAATIAEKASHIHKPSAARAMRAEMDEAIEHIRNVRKMTPSIYFIDMVDLFVHSIAMETRKRGGNEDWVDLVAHTERMAESVWDQTRQKSGGIGLKVVACFFEVMGKRDRYFLAYEDMDRLYDDGVELACLRFGNGDKDALDSLFRDGRTDVERITYELLSLFEENSTPDEDQLKSLFEDYTNTRFAIDVLQIALGAGKQELVESGSKRLRGDENVSRFSKGIETRYIESRLRHLSGDSRWSDSWLEEHWETTRDASETHFQIGMQHFGRGERQQAVESFKSCVRVGCFWDQEFHWARAVLLRLGVEPPEPLGNG
jgi:hypothetical protein